VRVVVEREGPGARVAVTDHGSGVTASLRRRLFRPFVRDPDPRAPAGLGLGLALVAALARAQAARVTHADAAGGGSEFSIHFPPAAGPPA